MEIAIDSQKMIIYIVVLYDIFVSSPIKFLTIGSHTIDMRLVCLKAILQRVDALQRVSQSYVF
jgi:hypothetical protein